MNVIEVNNLTKVYKLYSSPKDRLKEILSKKKLHHDFYALNDVSFSVEKGQTVGVIGQNGSGKSTLLQIICGVLQPTSGSIRANGRIAALLELGAGFNPAFTGRENVYMNGALMGFNREEMERRFPEIEAFAEIGEFIDQPVKTYSTGMFVRLAFSAAIHVDPDILIVDEALAVGDIFFRQKCYKRLADLQDRGCSIILVSHAMNDVEQFCQRALLLHHGGAIFNGPTSEAVRRYYLIEQEGRIAKQARPSIQFENEPSSPLLPPSMETGFWPPTEVFLDISKMSQLSNGWARCTGIAICDSDGRPCRSFEQGERASFFYEFELLHEIEVPIGGLVIQNDKGVLVHGKSTLEYGSNVPIGIKQGSRLRFRQDVSLEIAIGEYTLYEVGLATLSLNDFQQKEYYSYTDLSTKLLRLCHLTDVARFAVLPRSKGFPVQLLHHGIANLQGQCQVSVI
ncbi:MAG TPA: ABC transporter ATP-binding protein [Nitrospiria bacterium]|nr:ABC transporter ATP-binding protein [Nitrospiria bacterium]